MGDLDDVWNFVLVLAPLSAGALVAALVVGLVQRYRRDRLTDPKHDYDRRRSLKRL